MILLDDFYHITGLQDTESGFSYTVALHKEHWIYRAHFPGAPVTPGVCLIQMCTELAGQHTGQSLSLKAINNLKFLAVIDPLVVDTLRLVFSKVVLEGGRCTFAVLVCDETVSFAKLNLETEVQHEA
jgi:3-hydroxyacyl-[acyl-carrier-protein] dehydratase